MAAIDKRIDKQNMPIDIIIRFLVENCEIENIIIKPTKQKTICFLNKKLDERFHLLSSCSEALKIQIKPNPIRTKVETRIYLSMFNHKFFRLVFSFFIFHFFTN